MRKKKIKIKIQENTFVSVGNCSREAIDSLRKIGTLRVKGNIGLVSCAGLPDDLKVSGSLFFQYCAGLMKLPKVLVVGQRLDLEDCTGITELPEGLVVGGSLILSNCEGLTELPDDLIVRKDLNLSNCTGLTELPDGLIVRKDLDLRGCEGITKLPKDLQVVGKIWYNSVTGFSKSKDKRGVIPNHLKERLKRWH